MSVTTTAAKPNTFRAGPEGALLIDVFSPPREAYRQAGSGFAAGETPERYESGEGNDG